MPVTSDRVLAVSKVLKGFAPREELSLADYLKAIPHLESLADVSSGTPVLVRGDVGANLDMGAFEFQGIPCRADINGDSSVGIDDLLAVISGWGPCVSGEECNADLNLDFTVNIDDLLAVIGGLGPCR